MSKPLISFPPSRVPSPTNEQIPFLIDLLMGSYIGDIGVYARVQQKLHVLHPQHLRAINNIIKKCVTLFCMLHLK